MATAKKSATKKKKVSYMKLEEVDVQLHLQPKAGRMQIILTFPNDVSKILARRLGKRTTP